VNAVTEIALTKIDVLSGLSELCVCRGYRIDGQLIDRFPLSGDRLARCEPIYDVRPGWKEAIDGVSEVDDLPNAAQDYIRYIQDALEVPVRIVSYGPAPEQTMTTQL
jgi:adenylosuccinate synthase